MDTSPYCGHLSIMNTICILWTPLHSVETSPCILWTHFHYECNMHTMDTSPYCGHLFIMNAICILWIPLHTADTSPLWTQYAYYGYLCIRQTHTVDTFAYKSLLHTSLHKLWTSLHTKETYAQYGPLSIHCTTDTSAYYSLHLCIHVPWTPMHNIDTSAYSRQLLLIVLLVHTTDTSVILVSVY